MLHGLTYMTLPLLKCLYTIMPIYTLIISHPYYYNPLLLQDILKGALSLYPLSVTPTMDIEAVTAGTHIIGAPLSLTHVKVRFFLAYS